MSDEEKVGLETFLFDFDGDLYGEVVRVELLHFIRPERKFDSVQELEAQIRRDSRTSVEYLKAMEVSNNH